MLSKSVVAAHASTLYPLISRTLYSTNNCITGAKLDTLIMLMVTSAVIPVFKRMNLSPILGFLLMGTILGPSCLGCIHDVHTIDVLGEYNAVFCLSSSHVHCRDGIRVMHRGDKYDDNTRYVRIHTS